MKLMLRSGGTEDDQRSYHHHLAIETIAERNLLTMRLSADAKIQLGLNDAVSTAARMRTQFALEPGNLRRNDLASNKDFR